MLAAPADTSQVESQFWRDPKRLPPFPYFFKDPAVGLIPREDATLDRWYATDQVEEFARVAQAAVESFYREYAGTRNRTTPAFFAEKSSRLPISAGSCGCFTRGRGRYSSSGIPGTSGLRTGVPC